MKKIPLSVKSQIIAPKRFQKMKLIVMDGQRGLRMVSKSLMLICRFQIFKNAFSFVRQFDFRWCDGTSLMIHKIFYFYILRATKNECGGGRAFNICCCTDITFTVFLFTLRILHFTILQGTGMIVELIILTSGLPCGLFRRGLAVRLF